MSAPSDPTPGRLEGPAWDNHRSLTDAEETEAEKVAQIAATLIAAAGSGLASDLWEDFVAAGASLLEISRRHVIAKVQR